MLATVLLSMLLITDSDWEISWSSKSSILAVSWKDLNTRMLFVCHIATAIIAHLPVLAEYSPPTMAQPNVCMMLAIHICVR